MKSLALFSFVSLASVLFTACYEGNNLPEMYQDQYSMPIVGQITETEVTCVSANIYIKLTAIKYNSEVKLYYTDDNSIDPIESNNVITVAKASSTELYHETFFYTLTGLSPQTNYRYCVTYTDISGIELTSKIGSFATKSIDLDVKFHSFDYFFAVGTAYMSNIPNSCECGVIVSTDKVPTLYNCASKQVLNEIYLNQDFSVEGLVPETQYYYRGYAIFGNNVYYKPIHSFQTPKVNIHFDEPMTDYISSTQRRIYCWVYYDNTDCADYPLSDQIEIGLYYSTKSSESIDKCIKVRNSDKTNRHIFTTINGLSSTQRYYVRAYAKYQDQLFLSEEVSFKTTEY